MAENNPNMVPGIAGGAHIGGAPVTTTLISEAAPGLLRNAIDERIVKVRPMSTPIDQLSRCAGARSCNAMTVEYYSVDTKQTEARVSRSCTGGAGTRRSDEMYTHVIQTSADNIFDISETVLVPEVQGYDSEGQNPEGPLVLYVVSRPDSGGIEVCPVNGQVKKGIDGTAIHMPALPENTRLVRMGRAATELDVQTAQFSAMPRKSSNNCQIFK